MTFTQGAGVFFFIIASGFYILSNITNDETKSMQYKIDGIYFMLATIVCFVASF